VKGCGRTNSLIMFQSFADESGTDAGQPYSSFAGYIAQEGNWNEFSREWVEALERLGLGKEFHASDFYYKAKQKSWPQGYVDECILSLANTIKKWTDDGFAVIMCNEDYNSIVCPAAREKDKFLYHLLFAKVLRLVREFMYFKRDTVALFFDEQKGYEGRAEEIYRLFKKRYDKENKFVSTTFVDSTRCPPIQAADFLAFEIRRYGISGGHRTIRVRNALNAIKEKLRVYPITQPLLHKMNKTLCRDSAIR